MFPKSLLPLNDLLARGEQPDFAPTAKEVYYLVDCWEHYSRFSLLQEAVVQRITSLQAITVVEKEREYPANVGVTVESGYIGATLTNPSLTVDGPSIIRLRDDDKQVFEAVVARPTDNSDSILRVTVRAWEQVHRQVEEILRKLLESLKIDSNLLLHSGIICRNLIGNHDHREDLVKRGKASTFVWPGEILPLLNDVLTPEEVSHVMQAETAIVRLRAAYPENKPDGKRSSLLEGPEQPNANVSTHNDDRNQYIYDEYVKGALLKVILRNINNNKDWDAIEHPGHIRRIVRLHAERNGLPMPPPRNAGRKAGETPT